MNRFEIYEKFAESCRKDLASLYPGRFDESELEDILQDAAELAETKTKSENYKMFYWFCCRWSANRRKKKGEEFNESMDSLDAIEGVENFVSLQSEFSGSVPVDEIYTKLESAINSLEIGWKKKACWRAYRFFDASLTEIAESGTCGVYTKQAVRKHVVEVDKILSTMFQYSEFFDGIE